MPLTVAVFVAAGFWLGVLGAEASATLQGFRAPGALPAGLLGVRYL